MSKRLLFCFSLFLFAAQSVIAAERKIGVFVALADSRFQGIGYVPTRLGQGDDPDHNLYWGASDGLKSVFDRSAKWQLLKSSKVEEKGKIVQTRVYLNRAKKATLYAYAYRGSAIRETITDFEAAVQSGSYDLVAYIGHNGLMDFSLPFPGADHRNNKTTDCIVLCCKSKKYFYTRLKALKGNPVLLTSQFMYPGAFILRAALDGWLSGKSLRKIRELAGRAYARNQKISVKAGIGVFSSIAD